MAEPASTPRRRTLRQTSGSPGTIERVVLSGPGSVSPRRSGTPPRPEPRAMINDDDDGEAQDANAEEEQAQRSLTGPGRRPSAAVEESGDSGSGDDVLGHLADRPGPRAPAPSKSGPARRVRRLGLAASTKERARTGSRSAQARGSGRAISSTAMPTRKHDNSPAMATRGHRASRGAALAEQMAESSDEEVDKKEDDDAQQDSDGSW
eukprot:CAMPEP_0185181970 /NCGR_PEP_ID=MMETSP1140-20130426/1029_1 /TAXON_ID=298111 /ORGANISM="Pavlova sp., Strain CCMP459" /LENGTH=206 /DNA_ID=CAMNT_0027747879 /DNA_START=14 /DNA_END=631 /DNA_ORIENTATION=+